MMQSVHRANRLPVKEDAEYRRADRTADAGPSGQVYERLGYDYGGNLESFENSNIDEESLIHYLDGRGYDGESSARRFGRLKRLALG